MTWQGERLVKVRSESELRAGMLVVVESCSACDKTHGAILTRRSIHDHDHGPNSRASCRLPVWTGAGFCDVAGFTEWNCITDTIGSGRLYRLRDEQKTDEKTRTREVEVQR